MGPRGANSPEDKAIVDKLNRLLDQLHVSAHVDTISDIDAGVFVTLYEGLCGEQLSGIIRSPQKKEDEIHNCQTVIDSLSGDVLHTSLTHISGAEIMTGSRDDILNLIEIFSGLLEYMLNKIESDVSTDNDEIEQNLTADDPDLMTRDQLDEILEAELRKDRLQMESMAVKNVGPTAKWVADASPSRGHGDRTTDLIEAANGLSPSKNGRDTTADLIRETEEIEQRLKEATNLRTTAPTQTRQSKPRNTHAENGTVTTTTVQEPCVSTGIRESQSGTREKSEGLVRERERREEIIKRLENDPRYKYMLPPSRMETQEEDREIDETFNNLQHMVEETAAMARAAVDCSPSRAKSLLETLDRNQRRTRGLAVDITERSRRDQPRRKDGVTSTKRASPSARGTSKPADKLSDTELTPSKAKRKVSFLVERSLTDSSPSLTVGGGVNRRHAWEEREKTSSKSGTVRGKSTGYTAYDLNNKENDSYEERLRKQYEDIVSDVESPDRFKTAAAYRTDKYKELSSRPKALYTMGDTRNLVNQEQQTGKKKIGFLQKIYREDLDELLDEADYLMKKNRDAAQEQEKEYRKKMQAGVKKTASERQGPSVLKKTTKKVPPKTYVSSKVKKSSQSGSVVKQNKPLTIKDDEDILPMLLDEFPHLHLSIHTWHELWRKGLTQIEQITRSHQEVRRKKSQAQNQLEDAEKRQEIMVNIMKKELEHSQRLREIKERQAVGIKTKNKLHERRMQSAKSRHYYDEYQVRMRAKMLKRRTREEMIFKKLFKDGLEIQKERIKELRKYAREQRDNQAKSQRNEIDSIENYYRDQFQMLAENISKEKEDLQLQEKAKQKVLGSMKRELRKKMESEIKMLQEHLVRDDDDAYFRQLDADRVVHDLQMAKYQVRV